MKQTAWNDDEDFGFTGSPVVSESFALRVTSYLPSEASVYIHNSFFSVQNQQSLTGGAISYSINGKLLVELSTFAQCTVGQSGGAIYQSQGEIIIKKCCSYQSYCYPVGNGQFIFASTAFDDSSNKIFDSSIVHSMKSFLYPATETVIWMNNGAIYLKLVNVSDNYCRANTIRINPYVDSPKVIVTYCSFISNHIEKDRLLFFEAYEIEHSLSNLNINDNHQFLDGQATISVNGFGSIFDCCFFENEAKFMFYSMYGISISNCTTDFDINNAITGQVEMQSELKSSFSLAFKHTEDPKHCKENIITSESHFITSQMLIIFCLTIAFLITE